MISCTEFIPAYSELFSFLEQRHGRGEVDNFWTHLFKPDGKGIPLVNFVKKEGIRGCFTYWAGSLNEEAADFTMYLNEKRGFFKIKMHRCPSKGRLLELKESIGITPYHDYCLHCDHYRAAVAEVGLDYTYDFTDTDKAACSILITDPKIFDGRVILDADTEVMDRRAGDNEYFHRDFHSSTNRGIHYLGEKYGKQYVVDYLTQYTKHVYAHLNIAKTGLDGIKNLILDTYRKEKAEDALKITDTKGGFAAEIAYCPAVKHLHSIGREVSPWFRYTTEVVMEVLAAECGAIFKMLSYDEETGAARYTFEK